MIWVWTGGKCKPHLKRSVKVFPDPVALNDFEDSSSRGQKLGIGQIGGMHRNEDACASYHLQLLVERGGCVELHHSYLQHMD